MFLGARKLKKKEQIEENYISKVNTLKTEFICERKKKTVFKIDFQKFNLKLGIFVIYQS